MNRTSSHAFEIFVNGERLISSGSIKPNIPFSTMAHIRAHIPERFIASGMLVIAMRVYCAPQEWNSGEGNPGFYIANLTLGSEQALYRSGWLSIIGNNWLSWIEYLLYLALGIVALVLYSA